MIRKGTITYLQDTVDIKYHFVKINPRVYYKYAKKYSILDTLICHLGYMDNVCSYDNGRFITTKNIDKLCKVHKSTIKRQINGMIKDDILHRRIIDKQRCFVINPWLAMRGKRISLETYNEFKASALRSEVDE